MKQTILFVAFIALSRFAFAQTAFTNNNEGLNKATSTNLSVNKPEMEEMLSQIMNAVGLHPNFELREASVPNIQATIEHKKRYISYNPEFVNEVYSVTKDKWAVMMLLAHEVAHHLNGHTIKKSGSKPELELEADEFAGFVLHKLGATLEQSQEVMKYIATIDATTTHPARVSRMTAIQTGWNNASNAVDMAAMKGKTIPDKIGTN